MEDLNNRNIACNFTDIEKILKTANINNCPSDIKLYQKAFTHKSYTKDETYKMLAKFVKVNDGVVDFQDESYERLEFYGDSIICSVSVEYLFKRFPTFEEGIMTKLKTKIVSREYLSKFAQFFNFEKYLLLSNHMENLFGRENDRILEDSYEAFVGAISLDISYDIAKKFILFSLDNCVDYSSLLYNNENYKDLILNYFQKQNWSFPKYEIINQLGSPTKRTYVCSIYKNYKINNKWIKENVCIGYGNNKRDAEQNASYNALKIFKCL